MRQQDAKQDIYDQLQNILDKCPEKDITTLMGDFNANIGKTTAAMKKWWWLMGKNSWTAVLWTNLIVDSILPFKTIYKTTWVSPDHITENQIDHTLINKKIISGCASKNRSWRCIRSPPAACQTKAQVEKDLDGNNNKEKAVQRRPAERHLRTKIVQVEILQ